METTQPSIAAEDRLIRSLGLFDSVMMIIGIVIGTGIFLITGIMAKYLPSPGLILLAWVIGGVLALAGALTFAELGASMPRSGGPYVYLREAYGRPAGFLFGWMQCLVCMGGSIAAVAVGFSEYLGYFFPFSSPQQYVFFKTVSFSSFSYTCTLSYAKIVAVSAIIVLAALNYMGAGLGKNIQNFITAIKLSVIGIFIVIGFIYGKPGGDGGAVTAASGNLAIGFCMALVAVSWAFDGWNSINYIAGEVKNPQRNIVLALVLSVVFITTLYVLMNLVYLRTLSIPEMQGTVRIAEKTATAIVGEKWAGIVSAVVMVSAIGALNGALFVSPRVLYAMARDGDFFRIAAKIHPRYQTPHIAILVQTGWACVLTLSGTYEQLFIYVMFINIIFWIAGAASVFRLRRIRPDLPRPYKAWGYPVVPILFIAGLCILLIHSLIERPFESLAGTGLALLGIPVYYFWKRRIANPKPRVSHTI